LRLARETNGPLANDTIALGWNAFGRVAKVTGADGYILEYEYDNLDRITKVKYPDGLSELTTYDKLDVASRQDRMGRLTRYWHNKLGQLVAVLDPLGRWTAYQWCRCQRGQELIIDIISVLVTLFANFFGFFRAV
jgi:YD repeat-containing protein